MLYDYDQHVLWVSRQQLNDHKDVCPNYKCDIYTNHFFAFLATYSSERNKSNLLVYKPLHSHTSYV